MSPVRTELNDALKTAMKAKEERTVSTLRLILAALKDRDIAERSKGNAEGISDEEILSLLQSMIRQRREAIAAYDNGGRRELAAQEAEEIEIIKRFLPQQLTDEQIVHAVDNALGETGANSIKEMGKVMGHLRGRYTGRMDFAKAGALVKERLAS